MGRTKEPDQYSDEEAEHRAADAIRRSFEIPYKPQKEMVGKVGRPSGKSKPVKDSKKKP